MRLVLKRPRDDGAPTSSETPSPARTAQRYNSSFYYVQYLYSLQSMYGPLSNVIKQFQVLP